MGVGLMGMHQTPLHRNLLQKDSLGGLVGKEQSLEAGTDLGGDRGSLLDLVGGIRDRELGELDSGG